MKFTISHQVFLDEMIDVNRDTKADAVDACPDGHNCDCVADAMLMERNLR